MAKTRTAFVKIFLALACLLTLVGKLPADAQPLLQRNRVSGLVELYAAPNGSDTNNDCRLAPAPCSPRGAYYQAKTNYDFMPLDSIRPDSGCRINLAPGIYTVPPGGSLVSATGLYVGHYACQISGPMDANGCVDDQAVIVDMPDGGVAFNNQDGVIGVIACVWVRGGPGSTGFNGRQTPVVDILNVSCGPITICFSMTHLGTMNINGVTNIMGNITQFAAAGTGAVVKFWLGQIEARKPSEVAYLALANDGGHVEFVAPVDDKGVPAPQAMIVNSGNILGARCATAYGGRIKANRVPLPCMVVPSDTDGKFYP